MCALGQAHAMGARVSINHPFSNCKACGWAFGRQADNFDGLEVWNGQWGPDDELALNWWKDLLSSGRRITAIGSSDSHGPQNEIGLPTLHLYSKLDPSALLDAISAERAAITLSLGMELDLEVSNGSENAGPGEDLNVRATATVHLTATMHGSSTGVMILYSSDREIHRWPITGSDFREELTIPADLPFVRLEARDRNGSMMGLTNPVWLRGQ